jgi:hypothetical protein
MICTNVNAQSTEGTSVYISGAVSNKDLANAGRWVRVKSGDDELLIQLPKDYTEKMVIYYTSPSIDESLTVEIGYISSKNVFVSEKTQEIK